MTRRGRGKRSVTTFVDGTTAATSMSCNSNIRRSALAAKEPGRTAEGNAAGGDVFSALLPRSAPGRVGALPNPAQHVAMAGFCGSAMCVVRKSSRDMDEAPIPCSAHPDFERTLYGSPITCDLRITTITGLMPAAANAILRSSTIFCDP